MVIGEAVILERKVAIAPVLLDHTDPPECEGKKQKRREEERIRVGYLCSMSLLVLEHVNCMGEDRQEIIWVSVRMATGFNSFISTSKHMGSE